MCPDRRVVALLLVLVTGACGYKLGRGPRGLPGVQTLAVPPFADESFELGAGAIFAAALRDEVLQGDALRLTDRDGADAVVEGRLVALRPAALAFPTGLEPGEITVGEYRVSVALDVRVVRRDDGAVLFHEPKLQGVEEYLAGSEPIATADRRREALGRLAARMMADLHDLMLQGF